MKRNLLISLLLALSLVLVCAFAGCVNNTVSGSEVYIVTFHSNDENASVTKAEVDPGETVTLPEAPSRVGYNFSGWYLSYEDDATQAFDATKPVEGNITVYAKWQKDTTKSIVTLKYNNYLTIDDYTAVAKGSAFGKPADPVYNEEATYSFEGWFTENGTAYDFSSPVNSDITLIAHWTKAKATVKLEANYPGAGKNVVYVRLGEKLAEPAGPARDMFTFRGWYTEAIGGVAFDFDAPVNEDLHLYAHWLRSQYSVSFMVNGATLTEGTETNYQVNVGTSVADNASAIVSAMTYVGRDFVGWYKVQYGDEDTPDEATKADLTNIDDDLVVYAKWALKEYTVDFDWNFTGAPENPASQTIKHGKLIESPEAVTNAGHVFAGWYTDKACSDSNVFPVNTPVTDNLKLYAKWVESTGGSVTIALKNDDGSDFKSLDVAQGSLFSDVVTEVPVKSGYLFEGWYTDAEYTSQYSETSIVATDITLYAKMLKEHKFEAEAINLEGMTGKGGSVNLNEEMLIQSGAFVSGGASNNWYLCGLHYLGASIYFDINASEEVDDAILYISVTNNVKPFVHNEEYNGKQYGYLTDEEFQIFVNNTQLEYGKLYVPYPASPYGDIEANKSPFENMFIAAKVHLKKGNNSIEFVVNNNYGAGGGTYGADAPAIDYITIYANCNLNMFDYEYYLLPGTQTM